MCIETQWLLEPSILVQRFSGNLNLDEIEDASQNLTHFTFRSRQSKFHILGDLSELCALPHDLNPIAETLNHILSRSKVAWFVTYGAHDVALNFAAALMPQFTRVQHKHFHNQAEAVDFLSMMDASLPIFS